ncbi:MAG: SGNH/GDSL hydrolase family protein [Nannocystaceae bacterium]|nr:SGNH/GDSL hydrolase family protein [Nannocystaceae bacterium]
MSGTMCTRGGLLVAALVFAGCPAESDETGSGTDAAASTGEVATTVTDPSAGTSGPGSTSGVDESQGSSEEGSSGGGVTGDPSGGEICGDIPTRMMFFGDSLFACFGQDGKSEAASCSALLSHGYLAENYAPGVTYENLAVSGAVTRDVVNMQLPGAPVGMPGHTLVVVWVGGNDISPLLLQSDTAAEDAYRNDLVPEFEMLWDSIEAWVDDPTNFPDGATLIVNTQFNPFDACSADPFAFMSPLKTQLLGEYNDTLRARVEARPNTYLSDQYPVFLGHGHHFATEGCPNYDADSAYWMLGGADLVHPNGLGHVSIAGTLNGALDDVFACG